MHKHHQESIENMIAHYRQNPEVIALFLVGSVATGTERPDSDIDGVAIVSQEYYEEKKKTCVEQESVWGKCTYDGGYFDIHFLTRKYLEELAENGSEPMRNMFTNARVLYCNQPGLPERDFINANILGIGGFEKIKTINLQIAEGDKVFTLFTVEGIHDTGKIWDYPPEGKKIRYNAQYTAKFENGLIVEMWATMDGHTVLKQLGIIK
jgi:predicted nucleotidyltransferase